MLMDFLAFGKEVESVKEESLDLSAMRFLIGILDLPEDIGLLNVFSEMFLRLPSSTLPGASDGVIHLVFRILIITRKTGERGKRTG